MDNPVSVEFLQIGQALVPHRVVEMARDGSCLFHALSYILYENTEHAQTIRRRIVSRVLVHWERLKFWTDSGWGDNYPTPAEYSDEMLKPSTYGGACELIAAAELYHCRFEVYQNLQKIYSFGPTDRQVGKLRFTGNDLGDGHFDVYVALTASYVQDPNLNLDPVVSDYSKTRK